MVAAIRMLQAHWPEYLMGGGRARCLLMVSAGLAATLLEHPASPIHQASARPAAAARADGDRHGPDRDRPGLLPWGRRRLSSPRPAPICTSAMTLARLRLGKVALWDAAFYLRMAIFGGNGGRVSGLRPCSALPSPIRRSPRSRPPPARPARWRSSWPRRPIAFGLMLLVLTGDRGTARDAPDRAVRRHSDRPLHHGRGASVRDEPEPRRGPRASTSSPAGLWTHLWIYYLAPAARHAARGRGAYRLPRGSRPAACAKLDHSPHHRCIHCGYQPPVREVAHA